ncbi:hypothetical protein MINS_32250 [Mycolicibacterium insubricum]|uniref:Uncharacterized protein n=1 Tax=Mycolicibacterium insubricum TaxID=444597 RepID=A0A1X0D704_9MYCO|nr:hypothetical protein [Mycolicibacterium insubricum]ORA68164.1 hypothetical protein BST26_14530 [Mycolicibacterium insubricum]BBZ67796.1 hypothetical protein MINS_32250 [Mycolicibacterium insubricum]
MIPALDASTGALPVGRYPAQLAEIQAEFVDGKGSAREQVWNDWQKATALLQQHVAILATWVSGSFFTSKDAPDDIDCVYWVDYMALKIAQLNPASAHMVEVFSKKDQLRGLVGLRVDTFVVAWNCCPDITQAMPDTRDYWAARGHWDDFWARMRSGPKGAPAVRTDALPRRGYLEVIFDGFK